MKKKDRNKRKKKRKDLWRLLLKSLKKEKRKGKKKEKILWIVACHIEKEKKRKQASCRESRLTSQRNGFFQFLSSSAWIYIDSHKKESIHLLTTQTIVFV